MSTRPAIPADACSRLVALADRLGGARSARAFLRDLAHDGAGVRSGPLGLLDLARGGRNLVHGRGFRPVYDDGTPGQVRHFCGVARAACLLGTGPTRWLMVRGGDPVSSPDGQLTEAALVFVRELRSGRLAVTDAAPWIQARICSGGPS